MKNADMPAMPIELNGFGQFAPEAYTGLTKREMFAMHAMQGLAGEGAPEWLVTHAPEIAVRIADALLAELEKNK